MPFYRTIAALTAASLAAAASAAQPSPLLTKAKKLIAAQMADPSSLQFRKLRIARGVVEGKSLTVACGEYNAKNKMGGYVGYSTFAYEPTIMHGVTTFDGGDDINFFGEDGGGTMDHPDALNEMNARIMAVCLGIPQ